MPKHNNVVPNAHFHKKWQATSRGPLKVKLHLDQAGKKKSRRVARAAKAAKIAPRPLKSLRPVVRAMTQRYNTKLRMGRGFTLTELKAAGFTATFARTVGIAVDSRRTNKSEEGMATNVERLNEYKKNLVVFPRKAKSAKNGDSSKSDCAAATQFVGQIQPITKATPTVVIEAVVPQKAYTTMRNARFENKLAGLRQGVIDRKKKE
ncbi:hypothetical protein ScalyP_jg6719 [Parmales sp. scaly parma]|nr:hypothetical protein ScalyP_jg6719 [Parmales sp. scaly parma]